jgi:hypothetical protein
VRPARSKLAAMGQTWTLIAEREKCSLSHLGFRHLTRPTSVHLRIRTA